MCCVTQEHPRARRGFRLRGFHPLCRNFPFPLAILPSPTTGSYNPGDKSPVWAIPLSLATTDGIDSLSFPPVTEMFHFTGYRVLFPILVQEKTMAYYRHQVTPFGNLRIKAHLRLPEAYRSLARPSSPVSTKASTVCPLKLDSNFEISHAASSHSFEQPSPRFADLAACLLPGTCMPDFAVKITFVFGIRIYFQDRVRMARLSIHYLLQSEKNYFSMWMSKSGLV